MAWHDRIADDEAQGGWSLHLRWYEDEGRLEVSSRRFWPDGREHDADWSTYGPLTRNEARDVATAVIEDRWQEQQVLPGFEAI